MPSRNPPRPSALLNRVLAREHSDDGSSSGSDSDAGHLTLQHMMDNAPAGLRMEMEMVREGRTRDRETEVDRDACIVDRNQFFNTKVGVGYQHRSVVRQRTTRTTDEDGRVVDMTMRQAPTGGRGAGKKRHREVSLEEKRSVEDEVRRKKDRRKRKKKSKKRSKSKKSKEEKKERKSAERGRGTEAGGNHTFSEEEEPKGKVMKKKDKKKRGKNGEHRRDNSESEDGEGRRAKYKESKGKKSKKGRHKESKDNKREHGGWGQENDGGEGHQKFRKNDVEQVPVSPSHSSSSSFSTSSSEGSDSSDKEGVNEGELSAKAWALQIQEAEGPLQHLRDLLEEKIKAKVDLEGENDQKT